MAWLHGKPLNENNFMRSARGIYFVSRRCDLSDGVLVLVDCPLEEITPEMMLKATASIVGYHACNIHPELNGFRGYDAINYHFVQDVIGDETISDMLINETISYDEVFEKYYK